MPYLDSTVYPLNYDWLPLHKQDAILDKVTEIHETARVYEKRAVELGHVKDLTIAYTETAKRYREQLAGALSMLHAMNIYPEYNWPGHRGEWILADYNEAEMYYDWQVQCTDYD